MEQIVKRIKLYLFDMDGTLYLGDRLYDFTAELLAQIRRTGGKYLFMTNNSYKSVADYVKKLEKMGISDLADRSLTSLSGGQRQKVYIAMALAQDTPVVLLDEPNTFLDIPHQLQLMQHAKDLAAAGKTVVLVLHDLSMALEHADSLAVVQDGRCLFQGSSEETFLSGCLDAAFGVQIQRVQTSDGWKYYFSNKTSQMFK